MTASSNIFSKIWYLIFQYKNMKVSPLLLNPYFKKQFLTQPYEMSMWSQN